MIPSNMNKKKFICQQCLKCCEQIIVTKQTKSKKFCPDCINERRKLHYEIAKQYTAKKKISIGDKVGRPRLPENKTYNSEDSIMPWDEPNILGY